MKKLNLDQIQDQLTRENFKTLQEFMTGAALTAERFRVIEAAFTGDVSQFTMRHGLGFIPLDVLVTRLIAPSGAKLTFLYSEFTADDLVVTVSGLSGSMSVRLLVGSFPNVISVGSISRASNETQEVKSRF